MRVLVEGRSCALLLEHTMAVACSYIVV